MIDQVDRSSPSVRDIVEPLRRTMIDWRDETVRKALLASSRIDAVFRFCHPLGEHHGVDAAWDAAWGRLSRAIPDLERRDTIVMSGRDGQGVDWVGCCGYYTGTFALPFYDIPATRRLCAVRYHEFYRIEDGAIVEVHAIWDLPHLMMQAKAWPMGPSLGREWQVPGPATQDGLVERPADPTRAAASRNVVTNMLADMGRHPKAPVEAMRLDAHWHPAFSWYGPSGIGTQRGIAGFRHGHQIPFLAALPDRRGGYRGEGHFFAEGDYVAVTGWPNMAMTITGSGWLGIAPTGAAITMKSLDFWRIEGTRIRENWVLIDLLDVWNQLGVDVMGRMRELVIGPDLSDRGR